MTTITAQRLLTELGSKAWSGFNADDMVFGSDDANQAETELNCALRYLINLQDFPFRGKENNLVTTQNKSTYTIPEGQITSIYNQSTLTVLEFIGNSEEYDKTKTGEPTGYWIETNNPDQKIRLYPIPDAKYSYKVVYNQYMPVLDDDGNTKFEFENAADYINMPENLQYLFMDCLVMRTMIQNNKDEQDENYQPMIKEFNEMWKVFLRACKPSKIDNYIVF